MSRTIPEESLPSAMNQLRMRCLFIFQKKRTQTNANTAKTVHRWGRRERGEATTTFNR